MAATTIQLSAELKETLAGMKLHPRESYQEVLERLLEDLQALDEQTLREIARAKAEIRRGRYLTHAQLKVKMGF
jgi:predicted transcriptional regulator